MEFETCMVFVCRAYTVIMLDPKCTISLVQFDLLLLFVNRMNIMYVLM